MNWRLLFLHNGCALFAARSFFQSLWLLTACFSLFAPIPTLHFIYCRLNSWPQFWELLIMICTAVYFCWCSLAVTASVKLIWDLLVLHVWQSTTSGASVGNSEPVPHTTRPQAVSCKSDEVRPMLMSSARCWWDMEAFPFWVQEKDRRCLFQACVLGLVASAASVHFIKLCHTGTSKKKNLMWFQLFCWTQSEVSTVVRQ